MKCISKYVVQQGVSEANHRSTASPASWHTWSWQAAASLVEKLTVNTARHVAFLVLRVVDSRRYNRPKAA